MKQDKFLVLIIVFVVFLMVAFVRFSTKEDSWICEKGQWIKHGNPSSATPNLECK